LLLYPCFAGLLTLLILAGLTDLRERRIPNWLTGATAALYPVYVLLSPTPVAWTSSLGVAVLAVLAGLALHARDLMGGGDVKLIAAVSLWAGLAHFSLFALVTTLTGGALALICLWCRRWSPVIQAHLAGLGLAAAGGRCDSAVRRVAEEVGAEPASATAPAPITLPYGIAIAAGGAAVVIELMKL
jgi:prepilin peptidase CpaA